MAWDGPQFTLRWRLTTSWSMPCSANWRTPTATLLDGLIRRCGIRALRSCRLQVLHRRKLPVLHITRDCVQLIFAQSPQAKGRVERAAGTFQDRLVTELRLAGARRCEPRAGGLPSTLQRPLQGCAGVGSRLSRRTRRCAWRGSVLQVQAQSRQGQHGQIPLAHTSTAARHGQADLRRSSCGCARRTGR